MNGGAEGNHAKRMLYRKGTAFGFVTVFTSELHCVIQARSVMPAPKRRFSPWAYLRLKHQWSDQKKCESLRCSPCFLFCLFVAVRSNLHGSHPPCDHCGNRMRKRSAQVSMVHWSISVDC